MEKGKLVAVVVSKNLVAPLFGDVLQTVIGISAASFVALISSVNSDICGIIDWIKWIHKYLHHNILKGLFIVYFSTLCGFIAGIVIVVFGRKDNNGAGRSVVAAITKTVGGYFQDVLSATTVIVTTVIGFDNCFIKIFTIYRYYCCINTKRRKTNNRYVLVF